MEATKKYNTPQEYFEGHGYLVLNEVVTKELCEQLVTHLFELYEQGKLKKDDQCPLSDAIYGDPIFDSLLGKLAGPIGQHVGLELLPTYTYARLYRPGEVLVSHIDRPACQISGTMTLGFSGMNVWPIYFSHEQTDDPDKGIRLELEPGDLAVYRGNDLYHWRPEFKGEWQCQVFFHFVDANGPYADQKFDGRPELGLNANSKTEVSEPEGEMTEAMKERQKTVATVFAPREQSKEAVFPIFGGVMIPSWDLELPGVVSMVRENYPNFTFTPDECENIINYASQMYPESGTVGGTGNAGILEKEIRNVELYKIPLNDSTKWVFDKLAKTASFVNGEYFDYEIIGITHELQLLHYKSGENPGHYHWHQDMGPRQMTTRKISMSAQLSNPDTYSGGELVLNNNGTHVNGVKQQGAITCFPSYLSHRVMPMQEGERWALVVWVHGSRRFR